MTWLLVGATLGLIIDGWLHPSPQPEPEEEDWNLGGLVTLKPFPRSLEEN